MSPISSENCIEISPQHNTNLVDAKLRENFIKPQYDGIVMLSSSGVFFNDAQPRPDGKKIYHIFEQVTCEGPEDAKPLLNDLDLRTELFSKASEDSIKNIQQVLEENGIPLDEWCPPITREVDGESNPFNKSSQSRHFIQSFTENGKVQHDENPIPIFNKAFIEFGIMRDKISLQTEKTYDYKFGKAKSGAERVDTEQILYYCQLCDFFTKYKANLKIHESKVHNVKDFVSKFRKLKSDLEREVHTKHIFYFCQLCNFFTKYKGNLKAHEFKIHNAEDFRKKRKLESKGNIESCIRKNNLNVHKLKKEKALKSVKNKTNKDNVGSTKKIFLKTLKQNLKKTARFNRRKDKKSPSKKSLIKSKSLVEINRRKLKCASNRVKVLKQKARGNVKLRIQQTLFKNPCKKLKEDFTKEDDAITNEVEKEDEDGNETSAATNINSEENGCKEKGIQELINNCKRGSVTKEIDFEVVERSSNEAIDSLIIDTYTERICDKKDATKTDCKVEENNGFVNFALPPPLERSGGTKIVHEEKEQTNVTSQILNKKAAIEETDSGVEETDDEVNTDSGVEEIDDEVKIEKTNFSLPSTLKRSSRTENIHDGSELTTITSEIIDDKKVVAAKFDFEIKENNKSVVFRTPPVLENCKEMRDIREDQKDYLPEIINYCNDITKNIGFKVRENGPANFDILPKECATIKNFNQAKTDIERIVLGLQTKTPVVLIKNISCTSIPKNHGCKIKTISDKNDRNKVTKDVPKKLNGLSKAISDSGSVDNRPKENIECNIKSDRKNYVGVDCYENIKENISVRSGQIKSERKDPIAKENIPENIYINRTLRVLISDDVSNRLMKNVSESVKLKENEGPGVCIEINGKIKHYCPFCNFSTEYKYSVIRHMMKYCKRRSNKRSIQKCMTGRSPLFISNNNNNPHLKFNIYRCSSCNFASRSKDTLNTHQLIHSKRIFLNCNQCDYITNNQLFLKRHTDINHNAIESERKLTVKLEKLSDVNIKDSSNFKYSVETSSVKHLEPKRRESISEKFRCPNCSYVTRSERRFKEHSTIHIKNQFKCKFCSYQTKLRLQLREHMKSHSKSSKLIIKGKAKLAESLRSSAKVKLRCPYCSYFTSNEESLNRHKALHTPHKNGNRSKFRAHKSYRRRNSSKRSEFQVFKCSFCQQMFHSPFRFKKHLRNHAKQKTAPDPQLSLRRFRLPKRFRLNLPAKSLLQSVNNYRCTACDYIATSRHLLSQHKLVHLKTKILKCEHCNYETNYRGNLVKHVLIHVEDYIIN